MRRMSSLFLSVGLGTLLVTCDGEVVKFVFFGGDDERGWQPPDGSVARNTSVLHSNVSGGATVLEGA